MFVHFPDGGVQNLPDVKSGEGLCACQYSFSPSFKSWMLLCGCVPPGELMSHILREEPVSYSGAVRYLGPDHFIHQDRDHLEGGEQVSHALLPTIADDNLVPRLPEDDSSKHHTPPSGCAACPRQCPSASSGSHGTWRNQMEV